MADLPISGLLSPQRPPTTISGLMSAPATVNQPAPRSNSILGNMGLDLAAPENLVSLAFLNNAFTMSPDTTFRGVPEAAQATQIGLIRRQEAQAAEQERQRQVEESNKTAEWVKTNFPQFANLPPTQGFQMAMSELQSRKAAGQNESFFGNIVPMQDENGNVILGQASNQGRWQPLQGAEGFTPAPTTKQVDIGTHIITQDVYGRELYRTPKAGDVPTGYTAPDAAGAIAPMPGGPQDQERQALQSKAFATANAYEQKSSLVTQDISRAVQLAQNMPTTGIWSLLNAVPGSPQGDLAALLDTIEANTGFAELQEMRNNSPTGGALGSVTERELALLSATMGSLKQSQSQEQFVYNLQRLQQQLVSSQQAIKDAYARDFGGGAAAPAGGGVDDILSGYGL